MASNSPQSLELGLHQGLRQRMVPMQVAYGRMLEMSGPEVEEEVRRNLDENPALEAVDNASQQEYADIRYVPSRNSHASGDSAISDPIETLTEAAPPTAAESLESQLAERQIPDRIMTMARYVIGNLDSNGYLTRSPAAMTNDMAVNDLIADPGDDEMTRAVKTVQSLDPPGIGARDLRECLLLQLRRLRPSPESELAIIILTDHYDSFAKMHFDKIIERLGISRTDMNNVLEFIRSLNPKPGATLGQASGASDRINIVVPDFMVECDGNNLHLSLLNNIPELRIERSFRADGDIQPGERSGMTPAREFAAGRREEAMQFIKLLKMRSETLFRVMTAIINIQREFFMTDDESTLRPMILKDVATLTGYDLSVISRATAGKYVATAGGVYPLKLFFNDRPQNDSDTTTREILSALKNIIDSENHTRPLSDEDLTARLNAQGYRLARRTVTKYREKLKLPVARRRKRL